MSGESLRLKPGQKNRESSRCHIKKISYKGDNGAGWRQKKLPVEVFSTTGESLLACKLAKATQNKRYKPSDRRGVVEPLGETYAARPGIFPLPHKKISHKGDNGAGNGNRTRIISLGSSRSTIELCPHEHTEHTTKFLEINFFIIIIKQFMLRFSKQLNREWRRSIKSVLIDHRAHFY